MAAKKSNPGNPSWLKWIVIAFVGYAVYLHFTGEKIGTIPPSESSRAGLPDASQAATATPDITDPRIKVGGDIKGSGDEAQCGQTAAVRVSATFPDGKDYTGKGVTADALTVKVGKTDDTYPWMAGLTGMSAGGVREIMVPPSYLLSEGEIKERALSEKDKLRFRVQLDSLTPTANKEAIPMRVMDTVPGKTMSADCGDTVSLNLILWNHDGSIQYNSGKTPLVMQIGDAKVFYGLDRALLGMREGGVRTAIIPPAYIDVKNKNPVTERLTEGQVGIADISLISVKKHEKK